MKKQTVRLEKCEQCGDIRPPEKIVTRPIIFFRRGKRVTDNMRFCSDKLCGTVYQMSMDENTEEHTTLV